MGVVRVFFVIFFFFFDGCLSFGHVKPVVVVTRPVWADPSLSPLSVSQSVRKQGGLKIMACLSGKGHGKNIENLDVVGPVNNRASINQLSQFVNKIYITYDT